MCIDIAYNAFEHAILARADTRRISAHTRRLARHRSLVVLVIFTAAMLVAFVAPPAGFALICGARVLHVRPDVRGGQS